MTLPELSIAILAALLLLGCVATPDRNRNPRTPQQWVDRFAPGSTLDIISVDTESWTARIDGLLVTFHSDPFHGVYPERHLPVYTPGRGYSKP